MHTLSKGEITVAEVLVKLLGPVKSATTIMCEEEQLTVSMIAPLKAKLFEHFSISEEDLILGRQMKQMMAQELQQ